MNAVSVILSLNEAGSQELQSTIAPLRFTAFDLLYLEKGWVTQLSCIKRKELLNKLITVLQKYIPITESKWIDSDKQEMYDKLTESGAEGIILKNKHMPYITRDSRPRTTQIKRKVSVGEQYGQDIDSFVSGYVLSNPDKSWSEYIGALKLSVYLRETDGTEKEHWIATISGIPLELRKEMTVKGEDGKPELKQDYYGKVLAINGQDASPKALRFMHATTSWDIGFRTDKSQHECLLDREFLLDQVK